MPSTAPADAAPMSDSTNNNSNSSSMSSEAPRTSRFSIFSDAEWSLAAARSGIMSYLDEQKGMIGLITPIGSAVVFHKFYKGDIGHPRRFRRALLPAVLSLPVYAAGTAAMLLTYQGARTVFNDNYGISASLLASSVIGAATNIADGPRGMARGAARMSAFYTGGFALGFAWYFACGAHDGLTEDNSSADTKDNDTESS